MDKRRAMMEDYRRYREDAVKVYQEQKSIRLGLRGGGSAYNRPRLLWVFLNQVNVADTLIRPPGVDTDELDSNVDDWEEETIEFFINEEVIPFGDL